VPESSPAFPRILPGVTTPRLFFALVLAAAAGAVPTLAATQSSGPATTPAPLTVTSPTLTAGLPIPRQHTADGENTSPAFAWTGAPATTRSFALICDDPDVPMPQPFVHWVIYNIPATAKGLPANIPIDPSAAMPAAIAGAVQGPSGFRRPIYRGPAPPPGKVHNYHFTVYALDVADLPAGLTKAQLVDAMAGHIVAQGELVATYERKPPTPGR
jgi:Raf kinase inhibitor-like YbhB/YbcL family protein